MGLLDVFKDGELVETIELSASKRIYRVGRQAGLADIVLTHGSISREHATLTVSASGSVVVADLGSAQGTKISGKPLQPKKAHLLPPGRSLSFGQSTRIFKLREGSTGFVGEPGAAGSASTSAAILGSAALLEDPRAQVALQILRNGASDCEPLRPDGFLRLSSLLSSAAVAATGATQTDLAALPAKLGHMLDTAASELDGEILLRALDGHADAVRVDTSLRLVHLPASDTPEHLIFCSSFREWNAVRSKGAGAGRDGPPRPVRLSPQPPPAGVKIASLGSRAPDLHVLIRSASLLAEGIQLYRVLPAEDAEADAVGATGADADAPAAAPRADEVESIVCCGDVETGGTIGPWHFERVVSSRDGSVMMGADEVAPLRDARARRAREKAGAAQAKADAEAARQRQREASRQRAAAADDDDGQATKRPKHNPYLAHMEQDGEDGED
jgi:pSer/pThr/pTyr-binding forkhead associated (FHA) protein